MGYGALKYLEQLPGLQGDACWELLFNYLGQTDNVVHRSDWVQAAGESGGDPIAGSFPVSEKLILNSIVQGGELYISWSYSEKHYETSTIERVAAAYLNNLSLLIGHCEEQGREGGGYTPSDYGLAGDISWQELDTSWKIKPGVR